MRRNARPMTRLPTRSAHADADASVSMPSRWPGHRIGPAVPGLPVVCDSPGCPDPSGARSRKMSGWMVPKTEMLGPGNPVSAGPACVPADLRTNPTTHRGDSKRNRADPHSNQYAPHPYPRRPESNSNARPPTPAQESMSIAARIVRTTWGWWAYRSARRQPREPTSRAASTDPLRASAGSLLLRQPSRFEGGELEQGHFRST